MRIGDWCSGPDGVLEFEDIAIPADGTYRITVYYVHPNNDTTRHARISVTPGSAATNQTFEGSSSCCASKSFTMELTAGTKSLEIEGQEHRSRDRAPSVDKIVISRV